VWTALQKAAPVALHVARPKPRFADLLPLHHVARRTSFRFQPPVKPAGFTSCSTRTSVTETFTIPPETAEALEISEDNVKIRLHRGRAMVRGWLFHRVGTKAKDAFPFMGARCDRVVHNVFARLF
jgi:hypothetical protein